MPKTPVCLSLRLFRTHLRTHLLDNTRHLLDNTRQHNLTNGHSKPECMPPASRAMHQTARDGKKQKAGAADAHAGCCCPPKYPQQDVRDVRHINQGNGFRFRRSHTPTTISAAMSTMIVHSSMVLSPREPGSTFDDRE